MRRRTVIIATVGILFVAVLVAAVGFIGRQRTGPPETAAGSAGDAIASAAQFALPSTAGADLSLGQLRGSPVVVYFYEGAN